MSNSWTALGTHKRPKSERQSKAQTRKVSCPEKDSKKGGNHNLLQGDASMHAFLLSLQIHRSVCLSVCMSAMYTLKPSSQGAVASTGSEQLKVSSMALLVHICWLTVWKWFPLYKFILQFSIYTRAKHASVTCLFGQHGWRGVSEQPLTDIYPMCNSIPSTSNIS